MNIAGNYIIVGLNVPEPNNLLREKLFRKKITGLTVLMRTKMTGLGLFLRKICIILKEIYTQGASAAIYEMTA